MRFNLSINAYLEVYCLLYSLDGNLCKMWGEKKEKRKKKGFFLEYPRIMLQLITGP